MILVPGDRHDPHASHGYFDRIGPLALAFFEETRLTTQSHPPTNQFPNPAHRPVRQGLLQTVDLILLTLNTITISGLHSSASGSLADERYSTISTLHFTSATTTESFDHRIAGRAAETILG